MLGGNHMTRVLAAVTAVGLLLIGAPAGAGGFYAPTDHGVSVGQISGSLDGVTGSSVNAWSLRSFTEVSPTGAFGGNPIREHGFGTLEVCVPDRCHEAEASSIAITADPMLDEATVMFTGASSPCGALTATLTFAATSPPDHWHYTASEVEETEGAYELDVDADAGFERNATITGGTITSECSEIGAQDIQPGGTARLYRYLVLDVRSGA